MDSGHSLSVLGALTSTQTPSYLFGSSAVLGPSWRPEWASRRRRGSVALRPRLSPGLPFLDFASEILLSPFQVDVKALGEHRLRLCRKLVVAARVTGAGLEPATCGLKELVQLGLTRANTCSLSTACPGGRTSRAEYHKLSRAVPSASPTVRPTVGRAAAIRRGPCRAVWKTRLHLPPATSRWNRALLRSGSKLGSILSQPGEGGSWAVSCQLTEWSSVPSHRASVFG